MLDQIIKRTYYLNKHLEAPFLKEREEYLASYANRGIFTSSLKGMADYRLKVIEFLHLKENGLITLETIESAALEWARYQYNHPMKRKYLEISLIGGKISFRKGALESNKLWLTLLTQKLLL